MSDLFPGLSPKPRDLRLIGRQLERSPLLAPWLVCSCLAHPGESCDGVAVFALDAGAAIKLSRPWLAGPFGVPPHIGARPAPELERLRRWGSRRLVVEPHDPRAGARRAWRRAGWRLEGEAPCAGCSLHPFGFAELTRCARCARCPECACDPDCERRARRTTFSAEPTWDVWVGPSVTSDGTATYAEPGTGRVFSGTAYRNPFRARQATPEASAKASGEFLRWLVAESPPLQKRIRSQLRGLRLGSDDAAHGLILARVADGVGLSEIAEELRLLFPRQRRFFDA